MITAMNMLAMMHPYYGEGIGGILKTGLIVLALSIALVFCLRKAGLTGYEWIIWALFALWIAFLIIDFLF